MEMRPARERGGRMGAACRDERTDGRCQLFGQGMGHRPFWNVSTLHAVQHLTWKLLV